MVAGLNANLTEFGLMRLGNKSDAARLVSVSWCKNVDLQIKYLGLLLEAILGRCKDAGCCCGKV